MDAGRHAASAVQFSCSDDTARPCTALRSAALHCTAQEDKGASPALPVRLCPAKLVFVDRTRCCVLPLLGTLLKLKREGPRTVAVRQIPAYPLRRSVHCAGTSRFLSSVRSCMRWAGFAAGSCCARTPGARSPRRGRAGGRRQRRVTSTSH